MPGRKYPVQSGYRYGFNGKENDNEMRGNSNTINFGNRIYDARVGRWLSTDPNSKSYESSYIAFANNPIWILDPDGRDTIRISNSTTFQKQSNGGSRKRYQVQLQY